MVVNFPDRVIFNSLVKVNPCLLVVLDGIIVKKMDVVEGLVVAVAVVIEVFAVVENLVEDGLTIGQYLHALAQFCLIYLIQFPSNQRNCMNS